MTNTMTVIYVQMKKYWNTVRRIKKDTENINQNQKTVKIVH